MTTTINVHPYHSDDQLDTELAAIGYTAVNGWADQRPVTKDLVASRLAPPPGADPTTLAVAHHGQELVGWAALRASPPGGTSRLWGPTVHPRHQHTGLGRRLLEAVTTLDAFDDHRPRLTTAEIPAQRHAARHFYVDAGWHVCSTARLLHLHPVAQPQNPEADELTITSMASNENAATTDEIARLYEATHPHHGPDVAAATLTRWSADRRFNPHHLLLARNPRNELIGAVLLYPLTHVDDSEPPEVLLADVLTYPDGNHKAHLGHLVDAALRTSAAHNPRATLRTITNDRALVALLTNRGAKPTDEILYYAPPPRRRK